MKIGHEKAQKTQKVRHGFTRDLHGFFDHEGREGHEEKYCIPPRRQEKLDRMTGFLGTFSRSCVLGTGFSRCEHLRKPVAFAHGHLLWPKFTIRPAKKGFLLDFDLQEFMKILMPLLQS